jgi:thiamine-phosphate pyrophosphorylase
MAAQSQYYLVTTAEQLLGHLSDVAATCQALRAAALMIASDDFSQVSGDALRKAAEKIQDDDVAVLLRNDTGMARLCKADGLHLDWSKSIVQDFHQARETLGNDMMIGADAGKSRHDAMQLGEAGADYVAFGVPAFVRDRDTARDRQRQLLSWWADIFEVPSVATNIDQASEAAKLAATGADFLAITMPPLSATAEPLQTWIEAHKGLLTTAKA